MFDGSIAQENQERTNQQYFNGSNCASFTKSSSSCASTTKKQPAATASHHLVQSLHGLSIFVLCILYNVNPGLINHGLLIRGYSSNSHNLILKWYPPN